MTRGIHSFFTFLLCIALDWLWLTVLSGNLLIYQPQAWFAPNDLIFYSLFTSGLVMFSVYPALFLHDRNIALYYGAVFGLAMFGLYNLFNSVWYSYWPTSLVVADMIWGVVVGALAGFLSFQIGQWMGMSGSRDTDVAMDQGMFLE